MFLYRKISVKFYNLIIVLLTPFIGFSILNGNVFGNKRLCDRMVEFSGHKDRVRIVDVPNDKTSLIKRSSNIKTILYWTKSDDMIFGNGDIFASCPVSRCIATENRMLLKVNDFDVIFFNAHDINRFDLPQQRSSNQIYVFHELETQIIKPIFNDNIYQNFFNWTITYRRDSTLMRSYGVIKMIDTNAYIPPNIPADWMDISKWPIYEKARNMIQGKTKLVSWFPSDCVTPSKREVYVKAIRQHIPIDIFGDCPGSKKCNEEGDNCFEMFEKKYYFYFAFENSLCIDYISDNVFKALQYNIVPVVYGAGDYRTALPPGSYIDVRDFSKSKQLADHLWTVSEDPERYLSYFKWKNKFKVEVKPEYYTVCELCKKLYEVNRAPIVPEDIYGWWTVGQCLRKPSFKGISKIDY